MQKNTNLFSSFPGDIYAISADTLEHHKQLKKELNLDFPVLSDESLQMIEKAGLKDPEEPTKSMRGFVILDNKGEVIEAQQIDPFGEAAADIISYAAEKVRQ
ncbi:peroxiredoxin family protein [Neobacillus niacini]|nr:peroxiredoxin family protein [Neobacillus niacini]